DVEQRDLHRALGLATVKIGTGRSAGTGSANERFALDGLPVAADPELRAALLGGRPGTGNGPTGSPPLPAAERVLARFDAGWARYAPCSTTGLLAVAAIAGAAFQIGLGRWIAETQVVRRAVETAEDLGPLVALGILVTI